MSETNRKAMLFCAWFAPLSCVVYVLGAAVIGGYVPPLVSPSMTGEEMAQVISENQTRIRIGYVLAMLGAGMQAPWVGAIAAYFRRTESGFPVYTYAQLVCMGAGVAVLVLFAVPWGVAAFRPDTTSPEVLQYSVDLSYFIALTTWPIFTIWTAIWAMAILQDKSPQPMFPRWCAFFNLWMGLCFVPGAMILFFKHGPFSYEGVLGLYFPFAFYFVWALVLCYFVITRAASVVVSDEERPALSR